MRDGQRIGVVIPALNEADAIAKVVGEIPAWVDRIVVADNGSSDATGLAVAARGGRRRRARRGTRLWSGVSCGSGGIAAGGHHRVRRRRLQRHPEDMASLVDPIIAGKADMVIGSRALGDRERGSLTPQQRFGNWLATRLIRLIWRAHYTDLGPFRAIGRTALDKPRDGRSQLWMDRRDADQGGGSAPQTGRSSGPLPPPNRDLEGVGDHQRHGDGRIQDPAPSSDGMR